MLDPWIIDEIRRREEERHRDEVAERLPDGIPLVRPPQPQDPGEKPRRGVEIVDYAV